MSSGCGYVTRDNNLLNRDTMPFPACQATRYPVEVFIHVKSYGENYLPAVNHELVDSSLASRGRRLVVLGLEKLKSLTVCVL